MKCIGMLLAALSLLCGCGSAIDPNQADGSDCNFSAGEAACGATSFCDPGAAGPNGVYPRTRTYGLTGDKTHVVGTCRPKGGAGAACLGQEQCVSKKCVHPGAAPALGSKGVCE
jgi:hypothetical protein